MMLAAMLEKPRAIVAASSRGRAVHRRKKLLRGPFALSGDDPGLLLGAFLGPATSNSGRRSDENLQTAAALHACSYLQEEVANQ